MSPEQIEGGEIDHRSDIFAVGAVFYELLSYREAFSGAQHPADREQGAAGAAGASRVAASGPRSGDRRDRRPRAGEGSQQALSRMRRRSSEALEQQRWRLGPAQIHRRLSDRRRRPRRTSAGREHATHARRPPTSDRSRSIRTARKTPPADSRSRRSPKIPIIWARVHSGAARPELVGAPRPRISLPTSASEVDQHRGSVRRQLRRPDGRQDRSLARAAEHAASHSRRERSADATCRSAIGAVFRPAAAVSRARRRRVAGYGAHRRCGSVGGRQVSRQLLTITKPTGGTILGRGISCGTRGSDCSTHATGRRSRRTAGAA